MIKILMNIICFTLIFGKAFANGGDPAIEMVTDPCDSSMPYSVLERNDRFIPHHFPRRRTIVFFDVLGHNDIVAIVNGREYRVEMSSIFAAVSNRLTSDLKESQIKFEEEDDESFEADVLITATSTIYGPLEDAVYGYPQNSQSYHWNHNRIPGYIPNAGAVVFNLNFPVSNYITYLINDAHVADYIEVPPDMSLPQFLLIGFYRYATIRAVLAHFGYLTSDSSGQVDRRTVIPEDRSVQVYQPPITKSVDFLEFIKMYNRFYGHKIQRLKAFTLNMREIKTFAEANPLPKSRYYTLNTSSCR